MGRRDQGYAMIAAVASVAVFGYLALGALKGGHSAIVAASADMSHARLSAAADAGAAIAVHDLGLVDPRRRWSLSDSPHTLDFDDVHLTIAIEDENGKLPINFLRADQIRRLFEQARADPRRIDGLVEAFLDLRGDAKPNDAGAGGGFARIDSRIERERGPLTSLDELELLPGMTPELYARIAPAATVYASTLSFDPRTASPLALAVMAPSYANSPSAIDQTGQRAGETPALASPAPIGVAGRALTIKIDATDGRGGAVRRTEVVEFTGAASRPYVVRGLE